MNTADTREARIGRKLNEDERGLMNHAMMWGTLDWPYVKLGRKWKWEFRTLGSGTLYATKREAVASFEAFHSVLMQAAGEEAYERAIAEQAGR